MNLRPDLDVEVACFGRKAAVRLTFDVNTAELIILPVESVVRLKDHICELFIRCCAQYQMVD